MPRWKLPDPTVCAILLTRDRPEYATRAVEAFRAQTYERKRLLVVETGEAFNFIPSTEPEHYRRLRQDQVGQVSIGMMRNVAINFTPELPTASEIILHWDDDDWSHPNRISEQVALLQASGADAVGYREVLFWRDAMTTSMAEAASHNASTNPQGEAYLYTNNDSRYAIGSSLCYWRKAWEARPFEDVAREEDGRWVKGVKCVGRSALVGGKGSGFVGAGQPAEPRMICRIHAGNAKHYPIDELVGASPNWKRTPAWDAHCRSILG